MSARILLVEDNPANVELIEYLLRAFHHTVVSARDSEAALALAMASPPDLILLDIQLRGPSGFDVLRSLRAQPTLASVPVVAVTAFAMVGDRERILAAGFDGYLTKPIEPETFVADVERFLPGRHDQP